MTESLLLLVVVVATALAFDFTNGFHDTGNAMATTIATRALKPKQAVLLSASLNLVGAFLSLTVAATIAKGIVDANVVTLGVVLAGLAGGILWNLLTWLLGLPSSSSHALIGGVVGAVLAAAGTSGVLWGGLLAKVLLPALIAPVVAIIVGAIGTRLVTHLTRNVKQEDNDRMFRWGQIGSASLVSLAHGTNDAQKSMGIILLALIAGGAVPADSGVPFWVILSCALAMAIGTYLGGWRVIRTLGKGLVELESRQGMAAETSSAAVILLSSHFGYSLSTTHVATGSILGSGVGMKGASVRWSVAGRMFVAWLITVPAAATVGALAYGLGAVIGGEAGSYVVFGVLIALSAAIWVASRRKPVDHNNVNEEWAPGEGDAPAGTDETVATVDTVDTVDTVEAVDAIRAVDAEESPERAAVGVAGHEQGGDR
ncbi:inorganic phosphate transporter [Demequina mangrovi]|uniref:inorganic phosphate transporter n=1 Tax=Demequina mangrovi TaxID=1043493 RepID=UPI0009E067C6|nr:inorganic phosphate transporter [Demequina mangrovi]